MTAPDPGKGWRLVINGIEPPHPDAEIWLGRFPEWELRAFPEEAYSPERFYRVPATPLPQPIAPCWPDIPVADEGQCATPAEESGSAAVVIWIVGALVFVTGFLIGWSL